jgi:hypothetical protein
MSKACACWLSVETVSCRTGPLRVGRPLRGVYTLSRKDNLLWSSRWSEEDDPDQREGPGNPFSQEKIKRRANARPTRSGPVRQDMSFYESLSAEVAVVLVHPVLAGWSEDVEVDSVFEGSGRVGKVGWDDEDFAGVDRV